MSPPIQVVNSVFIESSIHPRFKSTLRVPDMCAILRRKLFPHSPFLDEDSDTDTRSNSGSQTTGSAQPRPSPSSRVNRTQTPSSVLPLWYPTPLQIRDLGHNPCPSRSHRMPPRGAPVLPLRHHRLSNALSVVKSTCRVRSNLVRNNHKRVNPTSPVRQYQLS